MALSEGVLRDPPCDRTVSRKYVCCSEAVKVKEYFGSLYIHIYGLNQGKPRLTKFKGNLTAFLRYFDY